MVIIGLNSGFDYQAKQISGGACALIRDGKIIQAVAEERLSRKKHDGGYKLALKHVLATNGLRIKDVDYFVLSFYGNSFSPSKKLIDYHLADIGISNHPSKLIIIPSHHLSHAYAAYFLSSYNESVIFVSDNEGSILYKENELLRNNHFERNSYYWAKGNCIHFLHRDFEQPGNLGFGKAYNKFTRYIGFGDYHNAGKTMGLSAYGKIPAAMQDVDLWWMNEQGRLESYLYDSGDYRVDIRNFFKKFEVSLPPASSVDYHSDTAKNLSAYIQWQLEKWTAIKTVDLCNRTSIKNVCYSGGVALNSVVNSHISQNHFRNVFVPPFPSDEGQALGNAIYGYINKGGFNNHPLLPKVSFDDFLYLGKEYSEADIQKAIASYKGKIRATQPANLYKTVASLLAENKILGLFNGKSEYGARALGNRSLIAAPTSAELRDKINTLKKRELFRPLAPAVLDKEASDYFIFKEDTLFKAMLGVAAVKKNKQRSIAGVVHADGTARVQLVSRQSNNNFYRIITAYHQLTGIPMVINTSFNMADEPIVETPANAIRTFLEMKIDGLILGNYLIFPHGKP